MVTRKMHEMGRKAKILLVEDDPNFGTVLKAFLELHEYEVVLHPNGKSGLTAFTSGHFDLCILDVMMPEMDGFTLAREIRKMDACAPFIFLTARMLKEDVMEGFQAGADDYITKPFDTDVVLMKITAILRRNSFIREEQDTQMPDEFHIGSYHFLYKVRLLRFGNHEFRLSPKETELVKLFCLAGNDVLPRHTALLKIWGEDNYFTTRSMDVFLARIRKYFRDDPSIEILNVHGNGFRMVCNK